MTPEPSAADPFEPIAERDWAEVEAGTVRVAMVGVGWWTAEKAVPAVADSDRCETTALVTGSPAEARDLADEYGIDHVLSRDEFHDGEAADAYDAVYVCTPNATHLEYVETAADLGKAVLCEKPMEATVDRAEELVAVAESVPLMVAYRMQTDPIVRRMRELVAEGAVGEPVHVHGSMSQRLLGMIPDPDQWRLNPELAGPGASVTDVGVYPLNTARFVLDADPVAVQASMASPGERYASVPDERAAFTVEFPGPVYATCTASQNAARRSHLRVTGAGGELLLEPAFFSDTPRCLAVDTDDGTATYELDGIDQMREEFDYFADRVLAGEPHHPDGEHGLVDVRTVAAVYESAESGERIRLD